MFYEQNQFLSILKKKNKVTPLDFIKKMEKNLYHSVKLIFFVIIKKRDVLL